jgi:hypothetical protein
MPAARLRVREPLRLRRGRVRLHVPRAGKGRLNPQLLAEDLQARREARARTLPLAQCSSWVERLSAPREPGETEATSMPAAKLIGGKGLSKDCPTCTPCPDQPRPERRGSQRLLSASQPHGRRARGAHSERAEFRPRKVEVRTAGPLIGRPSGSTSAAAGVTLRPVGGNSSAHGGVYRETAAYITIFSRV